MYQRIIVGGGSAGCVLASRLSEDPACSVLLLEAGNEYSPDAYPGELTQESRIAIEPPFIWGYQSVPGMPAHSIAALAGRVLGGGSAINAGISRRARPSDFRRWEQHGLPEWNWDSALESYNAAECGDGGPGLWPVVRSTAGQLVAPVRAFIDAAAFLGFPRIADFNADYQRGVGPEVRNVVGGLRRNAAMVYLSSEVRARPNLAIRANTQVDRVGFEHGSATTIHLVGGETLAADEIVLCAGVYGSPAILLRSGIGPGHHLDEHGIEVVADLPVGERLQDQPMYCLTYAVRPDASNDPANGSAVLWTASSEAGEGELDLQLSVSLQPDFDPSGRKIRTLRIWAAVVLPRSVGTLRLKSPSPLAAPRIDYRLLEVPSDRRRLVEIVRVARRIAAQEPVSSTLDGELMPGRQVQSDADLNAALDAGLMTFFHGTSTVPMGGEDDPHAVVDCTGRVRGVQGLRVVDASIFPEAISAPTNLTTIMVAERIASRMRSTGDAGAAAGRH